MSLASARCRSKGIPREKGGKASKESVREGGERTTLNGRWGSCLKIRKRERQYEEGGGHRVVFQYVEPVLEGTSEASMEVVERVERRAPLRLPTRKKEKEH